METILSKKFQTADFLKSSEYFFLMHHVSPQVYMLEAASINGVYMSQKNQELCHLCQKIIQARLILMLEITPISEKKLRIWVK